jgi:hypothetical protein
VGDGLAKIKELDFKFLHLSKVIIMLRPALSFASIAMTLGLILCFQASQAAAQSPGNPPIVNSTGPSGKINAWVARSGEYAVAVHIPNSTLSGKLQSYQLSLSPVPAYYAVPTTITLPDNSTMSVSAVDVQLVSKNFDNGKRKFQYYEMHYTNPATSTKYKIGYVRLISDSLDRERMKLSIRLLDKVTVVGGAVPTAASSGCDEPPADDVGEEEPIDPSNGGPGSQLSLSKTPPAHTPPSE